MSAFLYICIMATIKFLIQSENDNTSIFVRFINGRTFDLKAKTGHFINADLWDKKTGYPRTGLKDAVKKEKCNSIQIDLNTLKSKIEKAYNDAPNKNELNTQWLKDLINPPIKNDAITDKLIPYFDFFALHKKNELSLSTYKRLFVVKHLIERFEAHTKSTFLIKDFDLNFKLKFEQYCIEQKYATNTITRTIKFIKTVCYHAKLNDIETNKQLDNVKANYEKIEKIFLTPEDLDKIEKKQLDAEYLDNARDWLLISCETGQRVSDFMRFEKSMIRKKENNKGILKPLIEFTQIKTGKIMSIPLSKKVMDILNKRGGEFPRQISDQKYNDYIKEVCKIAEVNYTVKGSKIDSEINRKQSGTFEKWELVTSHIGRRTFATNNYGNIPTSILIYMTGHSTEKMFLEYIGKADDDKAMQVAEYF
jgi:integrase